MTHPIEYPPHPAQTWLATMRHSLDRIENYESIHIHDLRLEFACAYRQLRLGWPLIALLKAQQTSIPTNMDINLYAKYRKTSSYGLEPAEGDPSTNPSK